MRRTSEAYKRVAPSSRPRVPGPRIPASPRPRVPASARHHVPRPASRVRASPRPRVPASPRHPSPRPRVPRHRVPRRVPLPAQSLELVLEEGAFGGAAGAGEGALVGLGGALGVAGLFP